MTNTTTKNDRLSKGKRVALVGGSLVALALAGSIGMNMHTFKGIAEAVKTPYWERYGDVEEVSDFVLDNLN
jgi:hypothetical protein